MFILSQIISLPLERRAERMFSNCLATTWNGKGVDLQDFQPGLSEIKF
jgi:hypothetical protein